MIQIRLCGHSEETSSQRYRKHPERCYSCHWLLTHPQDAARRAANRARLREQAINGGLGRFNRDRALKRKLRG